MVPFPLPCSSSVACPSAATSPRATTPTPAQQPPSTNPYLCSASTIQPPNASILSPMLPTDRMIREGCTIPGCTITQTQTRTTSRWFASLGRPCLTIPSTPTNTPHPANVHYSANNSKTPHCNVEGCSVQPSTPMNCSAPPYPNQQDNLRMRHQPSASSSCSSEPLHIPQQGTRRAREEEQSSPPYHSAEADPSVIPEEHSRKRRRLCVVTRTDVHRSIIYTSPNTYSTTTTVYTVSTAIVAPEGMQFPSRPVPTSEVNTLPSEVQDIFAQMNRLSPPFTSGPFASDASSASPQTSFPPFNHNQQPFPFNQREVSEEEEEDEEEEEEEAIEED